MEIKIDFATIDDLRNIQELNLRLFRKEQKEFEPTLNLEWTFGERAVKYFSSSIEDNDACALVAKLGEQIVGYLVGWIKKKEFYSRNIKNQAEVENMIVLEEFRNKNIGTRLVENFLNWAKEKGIENIKVSAFAQNEKAINFYRKCGFKDYEHTLEINF